MFAFGECGYAAEIPAFAGMEEEEERRKRGLKKHPPTNLASRVRFVNQLLLPRLFPDQKPIPFRRKPESHSRVSENFPRSGTLHCSPSANTASPQRFRLSPEWKGGRAEKEGGGSKNILRQISPMGICFANQFLLPRSLPIFHLPLPLRCGIPIVVKFHMHQKMAAIFFRESRHRAVFVRLHALRQIASRTDIHHPARLIRHHIHRRPLFCHARDYRMKK